MRSLFLIPFVVFGGIVSPPTSPVFILCFLVYFGETNLLLNPPCCSFLDRFHIFTHRASDPIMVLCFPNLSTPCIRLLCQRSHAPSCPSILFACSMPCVPNTVLCSSVLDFCSLSCLVIGFVSFSCLQFSTIPTQFAQTTPN